MKRAIIILILLIPAISYCKIIHIPGDFPTIQQGIDAAEANDTVLVDVGIYYENIVITGHRITVCSKYLITGDTFYITQTIIDGNNSGSVVTIGPDDVLEPRISGFTITNGNAPGNSAGGGILIVAQNPLLSNLYITSNSADRGGGIACLNGGKLSISNSIISSIYASQKGGGIYTFISGMHIDQCQVFKNENNNRLAKSYLGSA